MSEYTEKGDGNVSKLSKRIGLPFMVGLLSLSLAFPSISNAKKEDSVPIKLITEEGYEIGFGTPKSEQDQKVKKELENNRNKVTNDRIDQIITIDSAESSTIEVPSEIPEGHYLVLLSEHGVDGAAAIYNKKDESVAFFSSPVSENGEELDVVNAKIIDETIIQLELDSANLVEPTNLLVTLNSATYSTYFSKGE